MLGNGSNRAGLIPHHGKEMLLMKGKLPSSEDAQVGDYICLCMVFPEGSKLLEVQLLNWVIGTSTPEGV